MNAASGLGKRTRARGGTSLLAHGESMLWLMGGALAVCLVMIVGLLALVAWQGATTFWPGPVVAVTMDDGRTFMGEVTRKESFTPSPEIFAGLSDTEQGRLRGAIDEEGRSTRRLLRTGNFEVSGTHFEWVDDYSTERTTTPEWAVILERREWGRFYGTPAEFRVDGAVVAQGPAASWQRFEDVHDDVSRRFARRYRLQKHDFGRLHAEAERSRLAMREAEIKYGAASPEFERTRGIHEGELKALDTRGQALEEEIRLLDDENTRYQLLMATAAGDTVPIPVVNVVRGYPANRLHLGDKAEVYASRWKEFLTADPREANSEGGVWPAIVGTVIMTLLMSLAVVPFGVLAALYLREYAKEGVMVSAVRIAINNMAGVPSIVFGVFGLGFFCYILGGSIDQLFFAGKLPNPTYGKGGVLWASLTLALLTLPVVVVATEEALARVP